MAPGPVVELVDWCCKNTILGAPTADKTPWGAILDALPVVKTWLL